MPQHTQHHPLIHVLLCWTTFLSIVQLSFITFYFATGHHGMSQNSSAVAPARTGQIQANNTPSSSSEHELRLGKGKMLSFRAKEGTNNIVWQATSEDKSPVSLQETGLKIVKDGYYFLNLQVTLSSCPPTQGLQHNVSLMINKKVQLKGQINKSTCSTGLLGKVELVAAGHNLVVSIDPPTNDLNKEESLTHLDIIYMQRP